MLDPCRVFFKAGEPEPPMKRTISLLALACLLWTTGCSEPPPPPSSTIQSLDRATITSVELALKQDAELASAGIVVTARNKSVVLKGSVASEATRQKATEIARKVHGVEEVANEIEVKP